MSKLSIERVGDPEKRSHSLLSEIDKLTDQIRVRAYELFKSDKFPSESDVDDWLTAEREICWPEAELRETDKAYTYKVALPGFEAEDVTVTVTPKELIVRAESRSGEEDQKAMDDETMETVRWSDFQYRTAWRRTELSSTIDVDKVKAKLERGVLKITAPKVREKAADKSRQIAVSAAE